jgi:multidrug efflux pump subunit AcrB
MVRYREGFADRPQQVSQLRIMSPTVGWVPLTSVAKVQLTQGPAQVVRKERKRTILVSAAVDKEVITSSEANTLIKTEFANIQNRYPGYELVFGGENEQQLESLQSLARSSALAVLLIYLILGTLFRSFLQPLIIMSVVPFAFIGVVVGHLVMMQPLGLLSLIGLAGLVGVVVNDSLVLVSFVNGARSRGAGRWLSVARAARHRLRPILLTSVTTVLGLAALSFQTRGQAAYLAPMAISIVWGLMFATVLTLVMVPCVMSIADDVGKKLGIRVGPKREIETLEEALAKAGHTPG